MPTTATNPERRRLNIHVSEETHYWLNVDAARHGKRLQGHLEKLLDTHAAGVSAEYQGQRPTDR